MLNLRAEDAFHHICATGRPPDPGEHGMPSVVQATVKTTTPALDRRRRR